MCTSLDLELSDCARLCVCIQSHKYHIMYSGLLCILTHIHITQILRFINIDYSLIKYDYFETKMSVVNKDKYIKWKTRAVCDKMVLC